MAVLGAEAAADAAAQEVVAATDAAEATDVAAGAVMGVAEATGAVAAEPAGAAEAANAAEAAAETVVAAEAEGEAVAGIVAADVAVPIEAASVVSSSKKPQVRRVQRDEVLTPAEGHIAGPGTYVEQDVIRARFDGEFTLEADVCNVRRPRREVPTRRRVRGEPESSQKPSRREAMGSMKSGTHRHGADKHGRPRAKNRKGRGDQGAWD